MALEQIAPHVDELAEALPADVDREEIESELRRFLEFGVPIEQAKQDILRSYGGRMSPERKIEDLMPGEQGVTFLARILSVNEKDVEIDGEDRTIWYGIFGDVTDTVPFTAWHDFELEQGDVVRVRNAYVKEWNDEPDVNLGDYTTVEEEDESLLPEDSVARPIREMEVADFRGGASNVSTTVRVLDLDEKQVTAQGEETTIREGEIADATGKARITCWNDFGIQPGDVIHVEGGYIRTWRGLPTLNLGDYAEIEFLDDDALPSPDDLDTTPVTPLHEILDREGGYGVRLQGTILEVKSGSGLVARCPECNRVVQKGQCRVHGDVDAEPDMRTKAVLDDGTAAGTLILGREITEELLGKTLEECQEEAQDAMSTEVIEDQLAEELVARRVEVQGNATLDDYGLTILGDDVSYPEVDVKARARELLEEVA